MYSPAGVTVGLLLIAVGAILVWAVTGEASGVDIDAVGWILMIVGAASTLIALIFWAGPWGPAEPRHRRGPRRRVVREEEDERL